MASVFTKNTFPPKNVLCVDQALEHSATIRSNSDSSFRFPTFSYDSISHMRCAAGVGFMQYEISGTDNEGHSFYIHDISGGMAASGADSISDFCYVRDSVTITQAKYTGRMGTKSVGTCSYDSNYLNGAPSQYEFTRN